ncbi:MAG: heme-binding domain-containing protein [Leptospiraceae bacterium]|nr:heme-binding domain-containing protein [Leptospiraceae bacterium]
MNIKKKLLQLFIFVYAILQIYIIIKPRPKNIKHEFNAPREVTEILERACYDCHSNRTKLPVYGYIVPINFLLEYHVNEGKEELNFSNWEELTLKKQNIKATAIKEEIESGEMPPNYYTIIHKEAVLNSKEKIILSEWVKSVESKYEESDSN